MGEDRKFSSYDEFFTFYLQQHSHPRNRMLHAIGTTLGIALVLGAFFLGHPWYALLFFPIGYGFAWTAQCADDWRLPWADFGGTRYEAKAKREGRTPCYLEFQCRG